MTGKFAYCLSFLFFLFLNVYVQRAYMYSSDAIAKHYKYAINERFETVLEIAKTNANF